MDDRRALNRLMTALRPWLHDLVLVGGWAHRLHRLRPEASVPAYQALATRDADLAFAESARLNGSIAAALREEGFTEEFRGDDNPPVTHYHLGSDQRGFYAEFLMPLRGSGVRRGGSPDVTGSRGGVVAQKLRHLEILLMAPWTIQLPDLDSQPEAGEVKVANPVTFIAQKGHGGARAVPATT